MSSDPPEFCLINTNGTTQSQDILKNGGLLLNRNLIAFLPLTAIFHHNFVVQAYLPIQNQIFADIFHLDRMF